MSLNSDLTFPLFPQKVVNLFAEWVAGLMRNLHYPLMHLIEQAKIMRYIDTCFQ